MSRQDYAPAASGPVETSIPGRLDFLPWSWWHWRMVIALGTAWILDGIEVTTVAVVLGKRKSLEDVAKPLSAD